MNKYINSFLMMMKQLLRDYINFAVIIAPILCGLLFRLGMPYIDTIIFNNTGNYVLISYYLAFDITLSILAPFMICFAAAMIMLEDIDDGIAKYEIITPLGKFGYLLSRIVMPAIISFICTIIILAVFRLSSIGFLAIVFVSLLASIFSVIYVMIIITIAGNKVEGMAIAKIANVIMIGAYIPFFIKSNTQYLFSFLPSFWITKTAQNIGILPVTIGLGITIVWFMILYNKFRTKLMK